MRNSFALILILLALVNFAAAPQVRAADRRPEMVSSVNPTYPYELSKNGIGGSVVVEFIIDKTGNTRNARVVRSSDRRFELAAVNAVHQWKFKPGEKDGRKVNVLASQLIEFSLDALPVYPLALLRDKIDGTATIEFEVNPLGRAINTQVVAADRQEFGWAAQAAVETCTYGVVLTGSTEKKRQRTTLKFSVDGRGDVPVGASARKIVSDLQQNKTFPTEVELAGSLIPTAGPDPVFPRSLASDITTGTAVVEFFVDEQGIVALPRVVSATHEEFGYATVQAAAQWTYQPPRLKGPDKVVRVQRTWKFKAPSPRQVTEIGEPPATKSR